MKEQDDHGHRSLPAKLLYQNDNFGEEGFLIFDVDPGLLTGQVVSFSEIPRLEAGWHPFFDNENKMLRSPGMSMVIESVSKGSDPIFGGLAGPSQWSVNDFVADADQTKAVIVFYRIQDYVYGPI